MDNLLFLWGEYGAEDKYEGWGGGDLEVIRKQCAKLNGDRQEFAVAFLAGLSA
jgi:hypothetical protein